MPPPTDPITTPVPPGAPAARTRLELRGQKVCKSRPGLVADANAPGGIAHGVVWSKRPPGGKKSCIPFCSPVAVAPASDRSRLKR